MLKHEVKDLEVDADKTGVSVYMGWEADGFVYLSLDEALELGHQLIDMAMTMKGAKSG